MCIQKRYINHLKTCYYDSTIFKKVEIFLIYIYTFLYNMNIVIVTIVHYYIDTIIYYTHHYSHL